MMPGIGAIFDGDWEYRQFINMTPPPGGTVSQALQDIELIIPIAFTALFQSGAAVANRTVALGVVDGAALTYLAFTDILQAANITRTYYGSLFAPVFATAASFNVLVPMGLQLLRNPTLIAITALSGQVADQFLAVSIYYACKRKS